MKIIRVKGSYYDMGLQFGKSLKEWHRQFSPSEELLEFARGCETAAKRYAPGILDELRGVADSSGTSYESLISTNLAPAAMYGCTVFAVNGDATSDGSPIFASQMDWMREDIEALHTIHAAPEDGYKSVGFSFGDIGRYGGQNETGLTIGSAYVGMYSGTRKPGIRLNVSQRWILDNFSTTEEAVDYLTKIPHTEPTNFLVADSYGTIARVETCPERTSARYLEEGIEVVTTHFLLDDMKPLDKGWPEDNVFYEFYRRSENWFEQNKGSISLDKAKAFCSDKDKGICLYADDWQEITIWSFIARTKPAAIEISPGPPCNVEYLNL